MLLRTALAVSCGHSPDVICYACSLSTATFVAIARELPCNLFTRRDKTTCVCRQQLYESFAAVGSQSVEGFIFLGRRTSSCATYLIRQPEEFVQVIPIQATDVRCAMLLKEVRNNIDRKCIV